MIESKWREKSVKINQTIDTKLIFSEFLPIFVYLESFDYISDFLSVKIFIDFFQCEPTKLNLHTFKTFCLNFVRNMHQNLISLQNQDLIFKTFSYEGIFWQKFENKSTKKKNT